MEGGKRFTLSIIERKDDYFQQGTREVLDALVENEISDSKRFGEEMDYEEALSTVIERAVYDLGIQTLGLENTEQIWSQARRRRRQELEAGQKIQPTLPRRPSL